MSLKFCESYKDETSIDAFIKNHATVIIDYTEWEGWKIFSRNPELLDSLENSLRDSDIFGISKVDFNSLFE